MSTLASANENCVYLLYNNRRRYIIKGTGYIYQYMNMKIDKITNHAEYAQVE